MVLLSPKQPQEHQGEIAKMRHRQGGANDKACFLMQNVSMRRKWCHRQGPLGDPPKGGGPCKVQAHVQNRGPSRGGY